MPKTIHVVAEIAMDEQYPDVVAVPLAQLELLHRREGTVRLQEYLVGWHSLVYSYLWPWFVFALAIALVGASSLVTGWLFPGLPRWADFLVTVDLVFLPYALLADRIDRFRSHLIKVAVARQMMARLEREVMAKQQKAQEANVDLYYDDDQHYSLDPPPEYQ